MNGPAVRKVRVLHVWNTGGAASVIARFSDRLYGTESNVIARKAADPVGLTTYGKVYDDGAPRFFLRALSMAKGADIVQVHSLDRLVPWLKLLYPRKPVIMYYLGSDIRGRWQEKEPRWRRADFVGYTTSDLGEGAPPTATQVFCPVDTDAFPPSAGNRKPNSALSIRYGMDEAVQRYASEKGLDLTVVERGSVPYSKMPELLARFDYFLDFRRPMGRDAPVECLGKAALEALSCGCKAVDWAGRVYSGLPREPSRERRGRVERSLPPAPQGMTHSMGFVRVVEVLQPLYSSQKGRPIRLQAGIDELVASVKGVRRFCDVVLVGDNKSPGLLKLSSLESAVLLERGAGVKAAPVIVARDSNRAQVLSAVVTAYGVGLRNLMLAWGDRYPRSGPKNVYDFEGLSALVSEAREIARRASIEVRLFAPVDLRSLGTPRGVRMAKSRLGAGADFLLAQPPTTDSGKELERHVRLIEAAGLKDSVLLGVFPFRSEDDVNRSEKFFGWSLPRSVHRLAESGREALEAEAGRVAGELRVRGCAGAYVSTRGDPGIAKQLLG
jgi:5,10-methylenetetrahydrofolate reductase